MKAEEIDCTGSAAGPSRDGHTGVADMHDLIVGGHTLVPVLDGSRIQDLTIFFLAVRTPHECSPLLPHMG